MIAKEFFFNITTIDNLEVFVSEIMGHVSPQEQHASIITLSGDLGAGKTTFTQKLGVQLGVVEGINSPTYVIEQRYPITNHSHFETLVHIDAYRLEQEGDPVKIGLDQTLQDPKNLVIIEWPEKIETFLKTYKKISLSLTQKDSDRFAQVTENCL